MASACTKISACVLIRLPVALPLHEPLHKHYGCVFPATVFLSASDLYDIQICQGVEKYHYVLCKYLSFVRKFFMSMVKSKHTHKKWFLKFICHTSNIQWMPCDCQSIFVLIQLTVALSLHEPLHKHYVSYGRIFSATIMTSASDSCDNQICQGVEKYQYVLCKYLRIVRKFFMSMVKLKHTRKKSED